VYTTPPAVVSAQVNLVDDVLRRHLRLSAGLGAPEITIVDPATGTGAYPLAIVARAPGARLQLVEPLAEAAAIARVRLREVGCRAEIDERDALAEPMPIQAPVLVCIGNPPYHRQTIATGETTRRKGGWVRFGQPRPILRDFLDPAAGVHAKSVYNDYVYFWRWAAWLVWEQRRGPGIVSLITPTSFLHGPGFGAMRSWLRRHLDALWVLDLEGDGRGTRRTGNVFEGVQTPVAICMGARFGQRPSDACAPVHYARLNGSREEKLGQLGRIATLDDVAWQSVEPAATALVRVAAGDGYARWPKLTDLFPRQFSGCQMKRRWPIAPGAATLRQRWHGLLRLPLPERARAFRPTRDRTIESSPFGLTPLAELEPDAACPEPVRYAYRSFDRQWVLPDPRLGDFVRPALWRLAGPRQIFLTSLLTHPPGAGPTVVATRLVPDLDHFRGSFGGRAVMPLWLDAAATEPNLAHGLLARLSNAYARTITPEAVLGYCYALLATPAYQARFEAELRLPPARVPLTARADLFERVAEAGLRLVRIQTFDDVPVGRARAGAAIDDAVGNYSVSGLRVVKSWLRYRRAEPWTDALTRELLELLWVIEATLELLPLLDALLTEVVAGPTLDGYAWSGS
jgi:predicted helicase